MEDYIPPPKLGNRFGGLGAIAMARKLELNRTQEVRTLYPNKPYKHSGSLIEAAESHILNNRKQHFAFGRGTLDNTDRFQ